MKVHFVDVEVSSGQAEPVAPVISRRLQLVANTRGGVPMDTQTFNQRGNLAHRERQIDAIRRVSQALFSHLSVDDLAREILRVSIDVLRADAGSIQLYEAATDRLVFRYVYDPRADGLTGYAMPTSHGIAGRVFRSGLADLTERASQSSDWNSAVDELTGCHTDSMLTAPLRRFGGEPIGVVQILNTRTGFDTCDLEVLEALCAYAASSLETARLNETTRDAELANLTSEIFHDMKNMLEPIKTGAWSLQTVLNNCFARVEAACNALEPGDRASEEILSTLQSARLEWGWILDASVNSAERIEARSREITDAINGESSGSRFGEVRVNDIAIEVCDALALVARGAGVALRLDLDAAVPLAELDSRQIYNALYNLANNAIPETPAGGSVTLRTHGPGDEFPDTLSIEVQDTGGGIAPAVRDKLFTDQAASTKCGGTGLGTRIVARVINRHHGSIEVASETGAGTTITLRLPLRQMEGGD